MLTSRLRQHLMTLLLLCMAWLAVPASSVAQTLDVTTMPATALSLTTAIELLEDPQRNLTLAEIQTPTNASRFIGGQPPSNALALGFTRSAYWLRLTLANTGATPIERILVVENPRISHVQLYQPDSRGAYQSISTGCDTPLTTRAYPNRNFVFPLTLAANSKKTVYLRVESSIGLLVPLQLWSPQAFHAYERDDYQLQAWYFGMASAMILFNLMFFASLRERIYLFYITFVTCTVCTVAIKNGMMPGWLWEGINLNSNVAYYSSASIAISALLLFMRQMLETQQFMPRADRLLQGLIGLFLLTPLAYSLALPLIARAAILLFLSTGVVILAVVLTCAFKRQRSAYFFLAAFALLMLGGTMTTLRALGIVPTNAFTIDGIQLGSTMEMLLLAFALADRLNIMRKETTKAQAELLHTQQELVDTLKTSERELEQRVTQRTDELQQLNRRLETLSLTDSLTGIANRRHFDSILRQECKRAQRLGHPLALAMLDVDWFKAYNDQYGHPSGDACLQQIAQVLSATVCRSSDLVARYGGEEFVFITPMLNATEALDIAEKVVRAVADLALPHSHSPVGHVTVSMGVAAITPATENSAAVLLQCADAALYLAKTKGRNRAELAVDQAASVARKA